MAADLQRLADAEKMLGAEPTWHFDNTDNTKLRLSVPLSIGGVIAEGLYLDCHCRSDDPEVDVAVNMTHKPIVGYGGALIRLDWNPIHTHANRGLVRGEWEYQPFGGTHLHPFPDNFAKGIKTMFLDNLPIAYPIAEALPNFREMLSYVGMIAKIGDIQRVPVPPWSRRLI